MSFVYLDPVYPSYRVKIALLKVNETLVAILIKYASFMDIFLPVLIVKLLEYTEINNYVIKLLDTK